MKNKPRWKSIAAKGLSRYEISEAGSVRIAATGKVLIYYMSKDFRKTIELFYHGDKKKPYDVVTLILKTFGNDPDVDYSKVPNITFDKMNDRFSKDEDDYALGANGHHWKELKKEIDRLKTLDDNLESF